MARIVSSLVGVIANKRLVAVASVGRNIVAWENSVTANLQYLEQRYIFIRYVNSCFSVDSIVILFCRIWIWPAPWSGNLVAQHSSIQGLLLIWMIVQHHVAYLKLQLQM